MNLNTKSNWLKLLLLIILAQGLMACATRSSVDEPNELIASGTDLQKLDNEKLITSYLDNIKKVNRALNEVVNENRKTKDRYWSQSASSPDYSVEEVVVTASKAGPTSITNNQIANVDEGDFIKRIGEYLVLLRRGRLYSVHIGDKDNKKLNLVDIKNVQLANFKHDAWYDEMLVYGNTIIVLGYSYDQDAAELIFFSLDDNGQLSHQETYLYDAFDYYSTDNYSSRLVNGELIFYLPIYLFDLQYKINDEESLPWPKFSRIGEDGKPEQTQTLFEPQSVYAPLVHTHEPVLHTVVRCPLNSYQLNCKANGIIGPESRHYFVSENSVYVWLSNAGWNIDYSTLDYADIKANIKSGAFTEWEKESIALLYKLPLNNNKPSVAQVLGSPIDQFSFHETENELYVLTREYSDDDNMWNSNSGDGDFLLLKLLKSEFSDNAENNYGQYEPLPDVVHSYVKNRFIGNKLLYSGTGYTENDAENDILISNLVTHNLDTSNTTEIKTDFGISRIERVSNNAAVLVGNYNESDLGISSLTLKEHPRLVETKKFYDMTEADGRSHGFNYSIDDQGTLAGLPTIDRTTLEDKDNNNDQPAQINYFRLDNELRFYAKGSLKETRLSENTESNDIDDNCEVSCVDWYGMARPIFIGNRVFALLGYELVEGVETQSGIKERARINTQE